MCSWNLHDSLSFHEFFLAKSVCGITVYFFMKIASCVHVRHDSLFKPFKKVCFDYIWYDILFFH